VEPAGALRAPAVAAELAGLLGAAAGLVGAARAANTRTAYGSDWARFAGWCDRRGLSALPATPATLGAYLTAAVTDPAGPAYVPATLARWVAAVNFTHRQAGHPAPRAHPHVGELLAGIRREHGRPPARRDALVTADLRAIPAGLPTAGWPGVVAARRDAALLVLGFAGAFRRAELAGLDVGDVRAHPSDGAVGVHLGAGGAGQADDAALAVVEPVSRWIGASRSQSRSFSMCTTVPCSGRAVNVNRSVSARISWMPRPRSASASGGESAAPCATSEKSKPRPASTIWMATFSSVISTMTS